MMPWNAILCRAAFTALLGAGAAAEAGACTVQSSGVAFGSYDTLATAPLDDAGGIDVQCPADTSVTIDLGPGAGTYSQRIMTSGAAPLGYNLYTDSSRTMIWADGVSGSNVTVTAGSAGVDVPVYSRIPALQNVQAGSYSDSVVITVTF